MKHRAVEEHDGLGEFFDQRYRAASGDYHRFAFSYGRRKIDDLLQKVLSSTEAGGHVIDIGCGTGEQLRRCADLGFEVSGVEPAARLRAEAQANVPEARIVDALSWGTPFSDNSADLVISIEVLRYLETEDFLRSCDEMARIVRPGGRIFVTLVNRWATDGYWLYQRGELAWARLRRRQGPLHCEFVSPRQIRATLCERGFGGVQCIGLMAGFLRILYKLGIGPAATRALEPCDDWMSRNSLATPFAGHLVVIARKE